MRDILDLLFPPHCAGCQKGGHILCPACIDAITLLAPPFCPHCGTQLLSYGSCSRCQRHRLNLSGLRVVSNYQEPLRSSIHALKYDGNTRLAEPLGMLMATQWARYGTPVDMVIPVPLHSERQRQRGYNHAHLLADVCAVQFRLPLRSDILVRARATAAQVDLPHSARLQNVAGAFGCSPSVATDTLFGRTILIIAHQ